MDPRLLTLACHACAKAPGENLIDCQCLLCGECFRAEVLASYLAPAAAEETPRRCRLCQAETTGESLSLLAMSERERLLTLCNCYVAGCYAQLKHSLSGWAAETRAGDLRRAAELNHSLAAAREREELFAQFFAWCVGRYGIKLSEVDPHILLKDRERVLRGVFEGVEASVSRGVRLPRAALDDTKKKETQRDFSPDKACPFGPRQFAPLPPSLLEQQPFARAQAPRAGYDGRPAAPAETEDGGFPSAQLSSIAGDPREQTPLPKAWGLPLQPVRALSPLFPPRAFKP